MFARLLLSGALLLVAGLVPAGEGAEPAKKDDLYPIYEHGVGRWLAFDAPLQAHHALATPGLTGYKLKLTVSILVREGKQAEVRFTFIQDGTFRQALRPVLPPSAHVDVALGDKSIAELPLTENGFTDYGDHRRVATHFATVPAPIFKKMLAAKSIRGHIYWRSENEAIEKNDLRRFVLDDKVLRTLAALDAKVR